MKTILLLVLFLVCTNGIIAQPCTTTNATSCVCENGTSDCLLLPDITASWKGISNNGYTEYPQTGAGTNYGSQGPDDGRLRVTGSTPNIGHGSFTVRGQDDNGMRTFLCGNDTVFNVAPNGQFSCPNGYPNPKQLVIQRIYKKNSNVMSYVDQYVGSMTYHPAHGHNHVDEWAYMTLRVQTSDPNPLNWPIIGDGAKIGFCLMDYGQCGSSGSTYDGHCRDDNTVYLGGNTMHNVDFPNWNLGGGNYNCSVVEQGISSGWTDVYGKHLDGMWINVPPTTCNGDYYIVLEIDRQGIFIEESDDNNWTAVPVTLTQQLPAGTTTTPIITSDNSHNLCTGESIELSVTGGSSFMWSTGETTQTITTSTPGNYTCEVTSYCGANMSDVFVVNTVVPNTPILVGDTVCGSGSMTLNGTASGEITWFDDLGILIATGNSFTTPVLSATTTYYALNTDSYLDTLNSEPYTNGIGGGGFLSSTQYLEFTSYTDFTLKSVLLYSEINENITIELQDNAGTVLQSIVVNVPAGASTADLNFAVPVGTDLRLVGDNIANNGGLYRNNNSATYPYEIPNVVSITGSSQGASYYYFFYNWEILTSTSECASDMVPVEAVVVSCAGLGENAAFKNSISIAPNPNKGVFSVEFSTEYDGELDFELISLVGSSVYSGTHNHAPGINNWTFNREQLAKGMYIFNIRFEGKDYATRLVIE